MILALWALLLLSAAVIVWVKFLQQTMTITTQSNNGLDAKALAHSGVMVALHPQVTQLTPIMNQQFTAERGYKVQMTPEGGRLNLNTIFFPQNGPDPNRIAMFKRYLERRGVNMAQQAYLIGSILNWLDPSNLAHLNGAPEGDNYHLPKRGNFLSVDELAQVKGSEPLVSQAGWEDDFTIYTNPGTIDLQSANRRVLESIPGVGDSTVNRFLQVRRGADGMDFTADDHVFQSVQEAMSYLGITGPQLEIWGQYVSLENPVSQTKMVHIKSTGQCGNIYRHVEVVATKGNMQPIIYFWKEL